MEANFTDITHATRKLRHLRVPVLPGEEREIKLRAASAGLPVAAYLRELGLHHQIRGMLDNKRVEELACIHGDLGRLGALLTLWLADDRRTAAFGEDTLRAVLTRIEETQDEMHELMRTVVIAGADR